jgi:aspartate racemase
VATAGVEVVIPEPADRELLDAAIHGELPLGVVQPELRERLLAMGSHHVASCAVGGVILGCTELPLVITEGDLPVPPLDTPSAHVDAILDLALAWAPPPRPRRGPACPLQGARLASGSRRSAAAIRAW